MSYLVPQLPSVALLVALLGCSGCPDRWADFHLRRFISADVSKIDGEGFEMKLRCEVENPNPIGAELWDLSYRATLGHHELARGRVPGRVTTVKARSRFELVVPVRVEYRRLPADLPRRTRAGTIEVRTEVWFVARTRLGRFRIHLTSTDRAAIDRALRAAVRGSFRGDALRITRIDFRGIGLRQTKLALAARVKNLFPFPIRIVSASYALSINGRHFGEGKLGQPLSLAPRAGRLVNLPIAATHSALGLALAALATTDPKFRVRGRITLSPPIAGIAQMPIDVSADSSVFVDEPAE